MCLDGSPQMSGELDRSDQYGVFTFDNRINSDDTSTTTICIHVLCISYSCRLKGPVSVDDWTINKKRTLRFPFDTILEMFCSHHSKIFPITPP